nr:VPA1262 family N-terminal domain-containing protein [Rubrivivax gelatinosus]
MSELDEAVRGLETKTEAREWLAANFGFDPLGDEEWRGSLSILAPDPLLVGVQHFIQETQSDGTERIVFYAKRRRFPDYPTADADALQLVTYERRPSGWRHAGAMPLDSLGFLVEDHKQAVAESGYTITCPKRGLLRLVPPRSWLRVASLGIQAVEQLLTVQVAAGGRRKPNGVYKLERVTDLGPTSTGRPHTSAASLRIGQLRAARAARLLEESRPQRLFGITGAKDDAPEEELKAARERALEYIVSLVEPAKREVYFVDVDWSYRETTLYAHRVARSGVKVKILTSRRIFAEKKPADAGCPRLDVGSEPKESAQVASARQTLEYLDDVHTRVHGADIDVRVMPGSSKPAFHDRFLVVDDDVWCCGPSFNELGERIGVISRSQLPRPILKVIREVWDKSEPISEFDRDFERRQRKSGEEPKTDGVAGESK